MATKVSWSLTKFDQTFKDKADPNYLYIVEYFMQVFGFQNNHFSNGPWLAGGTLRRLREGQIYLGADFDIFFKSEDQKDEFIAALKDRGATLTFESEYAKTYQLLLGNQNITVQAIHHKYYNMPSDVIAGFDITACQMATNGIGLVIGSKTEEHITKKVLRINQAVLEDPHYSAVHTFRRFIKMGADGYRMGAWHAKEFLEYLKSHPETIRDIVSVSPVQPDDEDETPF